MKKEVVKKQKMSNLQVNYFGEAKNIESKKGEKKKKKKFKDIKTNYKNIGINNKNPEKNFTMEFIKLIEETQDFKNKPAASFRLPTNTNTKYIRFYYKNSKAIKSNISNSTLVSSIVHDHSKFNLLSQDNTKHKMLTQTLNIQKDTNCTFRPDIKLSQQRVKRNTHLRSNSQSRNKSNRLRYTQRTNINKKPERTFKRTNSACENRKPELIEQPNLGKRKFKVYSEVFKLLDGDSDGKIGPNKIDITRMNNL